VLHHVLLPWLGQVYWDPSYQDEGKQAARAWCHGITEILKKHSTEMLRYGTFESEDSWCIQLARKNSNSNFFDKNQMLEFQMSYYCI
jgi:hypothetical protein